MLSMTFLKNTIINLAKIMEMIVDLRNEVLGLKDK